MFIATTLRRRVPRLFSLTWVLFAALLCSAGGAAAQAPTTLPEPGDTLYEIRTADGSTLYGRIVAVDGDRMEILTLGEVRVELRRDQIRDLRMAEGRVVEGEFWRRDRNTSRLFFTATGRTLRQGEGYLGTYMIILPFAAVGFTDALTIAGGAPVTVGELQPFYVAPKLRVLHTASADVSVGTLLFVDDDDKVGIAYGVGTFGNPDGAFTVGLGFGYSGTDFSSQPVAVIGGETRVGRRVKLLTENYFLPGETGVVFSGGLRLLGERFSADVGVMGAAGDGESRCCLPLLNVSYAVGR